MLLWRRFVGGDSGVVPLAVGDQAVATVDAAHDELVCVRRDDGQLLWRTPLGESLQQPALVGDAPAGRLGPGQAFCASIGRPARSKGMCSSANP